MSNQSMTCMYDDFNIFERFAPRYLWVGCLVQFLSTRNDTHLLEHMPGFAYCLGHYESLIWMFWRVSRNKIRRLMQGGPRFAHCCSNPDLLLLHLCFAA